MEPIRVRDGRLWDGARPFRFAGTNCYFLQEEGAREALGWESYEGRVEEAMRKVAGLGLTVMRAWAFHDDPDNPAAVQTAPGVYREEGLRGIDLAIALAARHGLRLILSLGNYWEDYGGVPQYLRWHGLDPARPHRFFTEPAVCEHYAGHIRAMLRRKNTLNGIPWGRDPSVLGWELMNEPRGVGLGEQGETFCRWVDRMAGVVRAEARQLVLTGEEGMGDDLQAETWEPVGAGWMTGDTGQDFARNTALVDVASVHLYPEDWGWAPGQAAEAGRRWIEEHAAAAARSGRPLVVGEFGIRNEGAIDHRTRREVYRAWMDAVIGDPRVCGALSWSFSTDDRPDEWDPFTWRWHTGTAPQDPINLVADLHRDWARRLKR